MKNKSRPKTPTPRMKNQKAFVFEEETQQKDYEWIKAIDHRFKQNIKNKISFIETLSKKGQPSRCIQHNIPQSLYCQFCRKVICASCMYSFSTHKTHKVIPLELASKEIRDDINNSHVKIADKLEGYTRLINDINSKTMESSRTFTRTATQLVRFYQSLFQDLKKKQKDQLSAIFQASTQSQDEYKEIIKKMSQIKLYMTEKFQTYSNPKLKGQLLVPSKGILQIMNNNIDSNENIEEELEKHKFIFSFDRLEEVKTQLLFKLNQVEKKGHFENSLRVMLEHKRHNRKSIGVRSISSPKVGLNIAQNNHRPRFNESVLASPRSIRRK